jgi:hypothetical protein
MFQPQMGTDGHGCIIAKRLQWTRQRLGVRQPSGALETSKSGRELPQSKTCRRIVSPSVVELHRSG